MSEKGGMERREGKASSQEFDTSAGGESARRKSVRVEKGKVGRKEEWEGMGDQQV